MDWDKESKWESDWWGNCGNTFGEKFKQLIYFAKMGLFWEIDVNDGSRLWLKIPENLAICDIGGGPDSALLQTRSLRGTVVDPCEYPQWTKDRYEACGVQLVKMKGEDIPVEDPQWRFDEVWIYNCLQHVEDPEKIINNAKKISRLIRVFEPIKTKIGPGHPHSFTEEWLNEKFGGKGKVEDMAQNGFFGTGYFGAFKGEL